MNDEHIEELLRKAPRPAAPAGLAEKLRADISLPRRAERPAPGRPEPVSWFRGRFPALAFTAACLVCLMILGVQTKEIAGLKRDNAALRASLGDAGAGPGPQLDEATRRLLAARQELEQLRKDSAELQQLRAESARLRAAQQEVETLRAENQRLAAAARSRTPAKSDEDFFSRTDDQKEKAMSIMCINNLKQIGLAARIWANDNNDVLPPDFLSMTNELSTPKVLVCPADTGRSAAPDWRQFSAANLSYEYLNPSGSETDPQAVLARCRVHNHVCLSDGSVQQIGKTRALVQRDGKYYISNGP